MSNLALRPCLLALLLLTTALACAPALPAAVPNYDFADDRGDIVHPAATDCRRVDRPLGADEQHPFGTSVRQRLAQFPAYRCVLRTAQGHTIDTTVRLSQPRNVSFREASCTGSSCNLCFSELTFTALLQIEGRRSELAQAAAVRQLDASDTYAFELRSPTQHVTGTYGGSSASLTIYEATSNGEQLWANNEHPCQPVP